jgi:hypothetical protein
MLFDYKCCHISCAAKLSNRDLKGVLGAICLLEMDIHRSYFERALLNSRKILRVALAETLPQESTSKSPKKDRYTQSFPPTPVKTAFEVIQESILGFCFS